MKDKGVIISKEGKKIINKNKGYLRLLKYLMNEWPAQINEENIWNEYQCYSEDLDALAKQGFLFEVKHYNPQTKTTTKYYKLGINGFQYLYLRRINFWIIVLGIVASISTIISIITLIR